MATQQAICSPFHAPIHVRGSFNAGNKINLLGALDSRQIEHTVIKSDAWWKSDESKGQTNQSLKLTNINIPVGMTNFQAGGGITVQLPKTSDLRTQIDTLSQQPGNEYLAELAGRSDIDWKQVEVINKTWDYKKEGMGPASAIVVAIVVTIATAGAASALGASLGSMLGGASAAVGTAEGAALAASISAAAGGGAAGAAAVASLTVGGTLFATAGSAMLAGSIAAGVSSIAVMATTALINNKGDLGAALKDLGSKDNAKNLLISMATAGLVQGLGSTLSIDGMSLNAISLKNDATFTQLLGKNIVNGVASAAVSTAINGGDYEQALKLALTSAVLDTLAAKAANEIGTITRDGVIDKATGQSIQTTAENIANKLLHGILGCGIGAAKSGGQDAAGGCAAGAAGATVGHITAESLEGLGLSNNTVVELSKLTAGLAAGLAGADLKQVNIGISAGANAVVNNRQLHESERALARKLAAQSGGKYSVEQIEAAMRNSSNTKYGENITAGMIVDPNNPNAIYDKGAVFNKGEDGKLVQVLPNNGNVDSDLAAFIQSKTGVANSPYSWSDGQLGISTSTNAANKTANRDPRTGLPLDDQGRYTKQVMLDGKPYSPKYFSCATAECIANGQNLDVNDPGTQAYLKAATAESFKDISNAANTAILVSPAGAIPYLAGVGLGATTLSVASGNTSPLDEFLKYGSQEGATKFFINVLQYSPVAAARAVAAIDLTGGWDAFVNRFKTDVLSVKPTPSGASK